jgi:transcriptional regulator with XRE-family HTH domain
MSPEELGKALSQARISRGLSLHDVERDTRISKGYLQALEQGELETLPAPVYARAFTRTYAQYLGMNAAVLVQHLPGARPEVELPPLPDVQRDIGVPLVSASWLAAGAVVVVLALVGGILFWTRGGEEGGATVANPPANQTAGEGAEGVQPTPAIDVEPGLVPELEDQNLFSAMAALNQAGIQAIVIQVEREGVDPGIVFSQSPTAGSPVEDHTIVTLLAGR